MGYCIANIGTNQILSCMTYDIIKTCKKDAVLVKRAFWTKRYDLHVTDALEIVSFALRLQQLEVGEMLYLTVGVDFIGTHWSVKPQRYNKYTVCYALHKLCGAILIERDDYR